MERWLLRISSSELRKHGLTVVRDAQEQLFAERFASLLKEKETKTMLSNLRVIFNADQDLDLEEGLLHFARGFSAVLNFEQWDDLGERMRGDRLRGGLVAFRELARFSRGCGLDHMAPRQEAA